MAIEGILTAQPQIGVEPSPIQNGTVSKAPSTLSEAMQVKVPSFDATGPYIYEIPAGRWMPRGELKPVLGDECLIVTDENGEPWVPSWSSVVGSGKVLLTIESFGAIGDDSTVNTTALQTALNTAHEQGAVLTSEGGGIFQTGELLVYSDTWFLCEFNTVIKRLAKSTEPYLIRNADYIPGNENIHLKFAVDGNKANIEGNRSVEENPSAEVRMVAEDGHVCEEIHMDLQVRNAKRLGVAWANVAGGSFKGLVENNGRDGFNLQSNCSDIDVDYEARFNGDDSLGINCEQNPGLTHDLHDIRGTVRIYGPGQDGPAPGITIRGGRNIDIEVFAYRLEAWGLGIFDAYGTEARDITVRGRIESCGTIGEVFYSKASVVLAAAVIHQPEGPYAAIRNIDLAGLKVRSPVASVAFEIRSARGAYGSLLNVSLRGTGVFEATTAYLLGADYLEKVVIDAADNQVIECINGVVNEAAHSKEITP